MRLLIVEDEPAIALLIEDVALSVGFEVVGVARNTREALEVAPDAEIAIVDVRLADGLTGPSIAKALRGRWGIAVVFLTANPELIDDLDGLMVVTKPATPEVIMRALTEAAKWRANHSRTAQGPSS